MVLLIFVFGVAKPDQWHVSGISGWLPVTARTKKVRGPAKDRAPTGTALTKPKPRKAPSSTMPLHPVEVNG
jgi:hypothetical protein